MAASTPARSTTEDMRAAPRPGEVIDRSAPLRFVWNGRSHWGFEGDTIVSALAASGVRVFSRSFKYHRPRGRIDGHVPRSELPRASGRRAERSGRAPSAPARDES